MYLLDILRGIDGLMVDCYGIFKAFDLQIYNMINPKKFTILHLVTSYSDIDSFPHLIASTRERYEDSSHSTADRILN